MHLLSADKDAAFSISFCCANGWPIKTPTSDFKVCMLCSRWSSTMGESSVTFTNLPSIMSTSCNWVVNFAIFGNTFSYHSKGKMSWWNSPELWYFMKFMCKPPIGL
uniref:Uncharacterized protein n=1 Tax=Rhizophora mucronata TaxID=61149 RepID=A0A2P2J7M4_RHIMU